MIKLNGTKLKCGNDLDYISFYFGCFINCYPKLIGWIMEGRKCAAVGGDQAFLMVVPL
jgi:hypothetical protein